MSLLTRAFLVSGLTGILWLLVLALWAARNGWRSQLCGRSWMQAWIATQIVLGVHVASTLMLFVSGGSRQITVTPLIYSLVALTVIPSVRLYLPDTLPRQHSSGVSLACLFASGMVVRTLQTA
jgi:hypothetical protein